MCARKSNYCKRINRARSQRGSICNPQDESNGLKLKRFSLVPLLYDIAPLNISREMCCLEAIFHEKGCGFIGPCRHDFYYQVGMTRRRDMCKCAGETNLAAGEELAASQLQGLLHVGQPAAQKMPSIEYDKEMETRRGDRNGIRGII